MLPITPLYQDPPITPPAVVRPARRTQQVDGTLSIEAATWYEDLETGMTVFEGGVKATYGPTVLTAQKVTVDKAAGVLHAEGETRIEDPEGKVLADDAEIHWRDGFGTASNVRVEVGYVRISGRQLETYSGDNPKWLVRDASVTLSDLSAGGTRFMADELEIQPGKRAVARRIFYVVLGQRLGPFPSQTFNLDRRVTGFKFPSITNKRGVGLGVSWDSSFLLDDHTAGTALWNAFAGQPQEYQLQFTRSFIDAGKQSTRISPRSDLGERASDSWFGNISVATPDLESSRIRDRKSSLTLGTHWNTSTNGRFTNGNEVSKAWDLAYELGGPLGGGGFVFTGRVERIRASGSSPWVDRAYLDMAVLMPPVELGGQLQSHIRADLVGSFSKQNTFGAGRAEIGLLYGLADGLTVGASYIHAVQAGDADFIFDQLAFGSGYVVRADYQRGPYTLRFLNKYDIGTKSWYDQEWEIAIAAGSLEPFMTRRSFPSDYRIGVRFRIDGFTNRLLDRNLNRK
ncbi:MAG: hypothetical protein JNM28_06625 [Armatimonadetes bacterium]|nr:hypothetical protein [Armatimonadota bacterium]